jgi:uncharacterized SAM-binding protein YcdF (DUF218 family)
VVAFKHIKKLLLCLALLVACAGMVLAHRQLFDWHAAMFSVQNAAPGADALVVLGGRIETRFPRALELYSHDYAETILLTDLRPFNPGIPDFDCSEQKIAFALRDYREPGAPVVVVPSRSGKQCVSTFDEAWDLLAYSRSKGYTRLIIVTDDFHTRRALYAFNKVFKGSGITVQSMGAANAVFNAQNWWRSDSGLKAYLLEPMLFCLYLFTSSNLEYVENY